MSTVINQTKLSETIFYFFILFFEEKKQTRDWDFHNNWVGRERAIKLLFLFGLIKENYIIVNDPGP